MGKISKSGIGPLKQIKSEHLIRIIDALSGEALDTQIEISGPITASYFVGDGSKLTNLPISMIDTGSLVTLNDFNNFTQSYNQDSSSFLDNFDLKQNISDKNTGSLTNSTSSYPSDYTVSQSLLFTTDFSYNFGAGNGLGKLKGVGVYPTIGKTYEQFLREISNEYIPPVFTSFNIQSEPQIVEVGTTISGTKTFKWGVTLNNGVIPTIDIYDNTAGVALVNTPNNGTKAQTITTIKLDTKDATQSWKGVAINTAGANVNSGNFAITALFNRYWGAVDTLPTNSADGTANRIYANSLSKAVKANGANTFTLNTGNINNKFIVLLPPSVTITSVIDTGYLNLNITSSYILSTITIKDAGGTDRVYNQYLFNPAGAYPVSTNHVITTN